MVLRKNATHSGYMGRHPQTHSWDATLAIYVRVPSHVSGMRCVFAQTHESERDSSISASLSLSWFCAKHGKNAAHSGYMGWHPDTRFEFVRLLRPMSVLPQTQAQKARTPTSDPGQDHQNDARRQNTKKNSSACRSCRHDQTTQGLATRK